MNGKRKGTCKILPFMLAAALVCAGLPVTVRADGAKVVTLGADLTNEQKLSMYEYFGTTTDEVETITVTNQDERQYMEGIASEAQIGTRTYSCSYVEPTTEGGIQVKVANLTFVTSSMIASTLLTSGVENCNVVAASPIEVSGTGALTGIMMAYETASGETLDEGQKEAATEELVTTGELAEDIGQEEAASLVNDVKEQVVEDGVSDESQISDIVSEAAASQDVTLTDDQIAQLTSLMSKISQYDYDVDALKQTMDNLSGKEEGFLSKIVSTIKGIFGGSGSDEGGIINGTNDSILGDNAVVDSTLDAISDSVGSSDKDSGFFGKIVHFFKGLFGGDDAEEETDGSTADSSDATATGNASGDTDASDGTESADTDTGTDTASGNSSGDSSLEDQLDDNATTDTFSTEDGTLEEVE